MLRIPFEDASACMKQILKEHGCPEEQAEKTAYEMARNSLEGVYTHGINRFARLIRNIEEGIVRPGAKPAVICRHGALEQIDGNLGLGVVNAWFAMSEAIGLAAEYGIGLASLRNTNHWMRAATYGYQACDAEMAGICFTNTMPNMPTWGAVDSRLGNNPMVFAFPKKGGHLIADMAMSQFSYGALELARLEGRMMPIDAGFDLQGKLTRNPDAVIRSQRILPAGYWKGAALSFMLDIFAAVLSRGNTVAEVGKLSGDEHGVSQIFIAVDYQKITPVEQAGQTIEQAVEDLLLSEKAQGTDRIIYTGETVQEHRRENLKKGIPVEERVWKEIQNLHT